MSTNTLSVVQARRVAQRLRFAAFITPYVVHFGGPEVLSSHLGIKHPATVTNWLNAKNIPATPRLLVLAELFDVDPHAMLDAAGRPPIIELRHAMAKDSSATLPGLLKAYQAKHNLSNPEAAARLGIDQFTYAKLAAGSAQPYSVAYANRLARGLGITVPEVLDAAAVAKTSPLRRKYERGSTGVVGMIRDTLEAAGINSWAEHAARKGAKLLSIPTSRMELYLRGERQPDLMACQKISDAGTHTLEALLAASGYSNVEAARLADAVTQARTATTRHRDSYLSVGDLAKAYRITSGLTRAEVAERVGYTQPSAVSKLETGQISGSITTMLRLSEVVGAPLSRLLTAAGLVH